MNVFPGNVEPFSLESIEKAKRSEDVSDNAGGISASKTLSRVIGDQGLPPIIQKNLQGFNDTQSCEEDDKKAEGKIDYEYHTTLKPEKMSKEAQDFNMAVSIWDISNKVPLQIKEKKFKGNFCRLIQIQARVCSISKCPGMENTSSFSTTRKSRESTSRRRKTNNRSLTLWKVARRNQLSLRKHKSSLTTLQLWM